MTEQVSTPEPLRALVTVLTQIGLTQTDLNLYSTASAQTFKTSASLASGFNSVWSMYEAMLAGATASLLMGSFRAGRGRPDGRRVVTARQRTILPRSCSLVALQWYHHAGGNG